MGDTLTIRLYEHDETRARVEGQDAEVEAHGWGYRVGDSIQVDGIEYVVMALGSSIETGDVRGNYVRAELANMEDARS